MCVCVFVLSIYSFMYSYLYIYSFIYLHIHTISYNISTSKHLLSPDLDLLGLLLESGRPQFTTPILTSKTYWSQ